MLELFKDFLSGSVTEKHYKAMLYSFIIFYKAILLLEIIHLLSASLQMLTVRSLWLGWCWRYLLIFSGSVSCLPSPDSVVSQYIFSSLTPLPLSFFVIPLKSHTIDITSLFLIYHICFLSFSSPIGAAYVSRTSEMIYFSMLENSTEEFMMRNYKKFY